MNIFTVKARGNYGGGMAVVQAETQSRAVELCSTIHDVWSTRYHRPESIELICTIDSTEEKLLDHFETGE